MEMEMDMDGKRIKRSNQSAEMEGEGRDWSNLTSPILLSILSLLQTLQDFFAFRGVCSSWRSLSHPTPSSLSSQSPLLLLTRSSRRSKALFDLRLARLYSTPLPWGLDTRRTLAYSHGHLITSTPPSSLPHKLLLFNLFTHHKTRLPKTPLRFDRVLLTSPPSSPDCHVLLLEPGLSVLQYCRPWDSQWRVCRWGGQLRIADMVVYGGELYALTVAGRLGIIRFDPVNVDKPEFVGLDGQDSIGLDMSIKNSRWFLAECGGELLLVCIRYFGGDWYVKIDVRGWDFERGRWREVGSLGDRAVFFGSNGFAASISGSVGSGVRENCVYCCTNREMNEWIVYSLEDQVAEIGSTCSVTGLGRGWLDEYPVWVFPSIC